VAPIRALGPLAHRVEPPRVGGVLLAGDAAGFYDPFTGEGVFTALRSAELAAETIVRALRSGDTSARALGAYAEARRQAFRGKERVTRALQVVIAHRRPANLACRALARRPQLLDALLGVFGDYVPPRALVAALSGR
jgi:flavin-dependent dehydrogenase